MIGSTEYSDWGFWLVVIHFSCIFTLIDQLNPHDFKRKYKFTFSELPGRSVSHYSSYPQGPVWYSNSSAAGNKAQRRVIKTAQKISSIELPTLEETSSSSCLRSAPSTLTSHIGSSPLFEVLHCAWGGCAYLLRHRLHGWIATLIPCYNTVITFYYYFKFIKCQ